MDFIVGLFSWDGLFLAIDIFVINQCINTCYKQYIYEKLIENALVLPINFSLRQIVASQKSMKIPFAVIRGTVVPTVCPKFNPIPVLQQVHIREHSLRRAMFGLWIQCQKSLSMTTHEVPFQLQNHFNYVSVQNPISADYLSIPLVSDTFTPSKPAYFQAIWTFIMGKKTLGIQTITHSLLEGETLTVAGELGFDLDSLCIRPPSVGPYILTTGALPKYTNRPVLAYVGILLFSYSAYKLLRRIYRRAQNRRSNKPASRGFSPPPTCLPSNTITEPGTPNALSNCCICQDEPINILCLPCGHLCMCNQCSTRIENRCPICRSVIERFTRIFTS